MGFFDFLRKKKPAAPASPHPNILLLRTMQEQLISMGYDVRPHDKYQGLIVNSELEIATGIIDNPDVHPLVIHAMVIAIHPVYFPEGIAESIAGLGDTLESKVASLISNYLPTTFEPIMDCLVHKHNPGLAIQKLPAGSHWHTTLGPLALQGQWISEPPADSYFNLLKEQLEKQLPDQELNWVKVYISKSFGDVSAGECLLNNEPWEEGMQIVYDHAKSWQYEAEFLGQKQFMMFRKAHGHQ